MAEQHSNTEQWKQIRDFPDYAVSNLGRIRRHTPSIGTRVGKILKLQLSKENGYVRVQLRRVGRARTLRVHRLVVVTFIGDYPPHLPHTNHKDADRSNNDVLNLEWTNRSLNQKHAYKIGRRTNQGDSNPNAVVTEETAMKMIQLAQTGISHAELGRRFGLSRSSANQLITGWTWKHLPR